MLGDMDTRIFRSLADQDAGAVNNPVFRALTRSLRKTHNSVLGDVPPFKCLCSFLIKYFTHTKIKHNLCNI